MQTFYVSFSGGGRFLGAVVADAEDITTLLSVLTAHGCNPGGEMAAWDITGGACPYPKLTLMSKADMERIDGEPGWYLGDMTPAEREKVMDRLVGIACESCNDPAKN